MLIRPCTAKLLQLSVKVNRYGNPIQAFSNDSLQVLSKTPGARCHSNVSTGQQGGLGKNDNRALAQYRATGPNVSVPLNPGFRNLLNPRAGRLDHKGVALTAAVSHTYLWNSSSSV